MLPKVPPPPPEAPNAEVLPLPNPVVGFCPNAEFVPLEPPNKPPPVLVLLAPNPPVAGLFAPNTLLVLLAPNGDACCCVDPNAPEDPNGDAAGLLKLDPNPDVVFPVFPNGDALDCPPKSPPPVDGCCC